MTTILFKKLNHKEQKIFIIHAPAEFKAEMDSLKKNGNNVTEGTMKAISKIKQIDFLLSFVKTSAEVEEIIAAVYERLQPDAIVWFAYPKGSSKKYKAEINRDHGWEALGKRGFDTVRSVAIDSDWTGLRFRQVEYIKVMKRNPSLALSAEGKKRTGKK